MRNRSTVLALLFLLAVLVRPADADIRRDPTGVNVNSQGPTSVYITFGGLVNQTPAESLWCGELIPATPDRGQKCDPNTIYGRLPIRYDRSSLSTNAYTDIMTIPATVARRAYQAAERGALSPFFYVRRFQSTTGGPDEYVFVTCRPGAGGARTPFSIVDVRLAFAIDKPLLSVKVNDTAPSLSAQISYTGTGRLKGRWEIVLPSDERPSVTDLLTEATLPPDQRPLQRRYNELERFNIFLPPTGRVTLPGPDPKRIPTANEGFHEILLRIEASDDKDSESNLESASAGVGVVFGGAVAGFPMPTLRYYVGSAPAELLPGATGGLALLSPANRSVVAAQVAALFRWAPVGSTSLYRLEIHGPDGALLHEALLAGGTTSYTAPSWLADKAGDAVLTWSVTAQGAEGRDLASSGGAELRFEKMEKEMTPFSLPTPAPTPTAAPAPSLSLLDSTPLPRGGPLEPEGGHRRDQRVGARDARGAQDVLRDEHMVPEGSLRAHLLHFGIGSFCDGKPPIGSPLGVVEQGGKLSFLGRSGPAGTSCIFVLKEWFERNGIIGSKWKVEKAGPGEQCKAGAGTALATTRGMAVIGEDGDVATGAAFLSDQEDVATSDGVVFAHGNTDPVSVLKPATVAYSCPITLGADVRTIRFTLDEVTFLAAPGRSFP